MKNHSWAPSLTYILPSFLPALTGNERVGPWRSAWWRWRSCGAGAGADTATIPPSPIPATNPIPVPLSLYSRPSPRVVGVQLGPRVLPPPQLWSLLAAPFLTRTPMFQFLVSLESRCHPKEVWQWRVHPLRDSFIHFPIAFIYSCFFVMVLGKCGVSEYWAQCFMTICVCPPFIYHCASWPYLLSPTIAIPFALWNHLLWEHCNFMYIL